ncbi:hypothetical protein [Effusibacillus pohliae]|uniref:hypothetical protein n=1 Tax=Effusibacillus pohliae TaxID=232270 RepID=UPI00036E741A|nr:hypothetical protein [Effusibacillus pohliae]
MTTGTIARDEQQAKRKLEMEEKILRYFQNKEIANERKEENKLLFEEIEQFFEEMEEEELVYQLPNGEYAVLTKKATVREVLDKEALAHELLIAKDELKTPFDFSMLTSQGKLTPDMISRHTSTVTDIRVKLSKRKTKPRKRKSDASMHAGH